MDPDWLTFPFQFQLAILQSLNIQTGSRTSCLTDQDLSRTSLRGEPRSDIDVVTQSGEICRPLFASHYADKCRAGMDSDPYRQPGSFGIVLAGESQQLLGRLHRPVWVLRSCETWKKKTNRLVSQQAV